MKTVTILFVQIVVSFICFQSEAATCETLRNFTWSNNTTQDALNWSCGRRPQQGDIIIIRHRVSISGNQVITGTSIVRIEIRSGGELNFPGPGDKFEIPENSGIILYSGTPPGRITGVNSSNQIRVGQGGPDWSCSNTTCPFNGPNSIGNPNALPIRLLSFDVRKESGEVKLEWITASEENNDYFTLERSLDGSRFDSIGTVDGAGNSKSVLKYSFIDTQPYQGTAYYRLKQTDYDLKMSYSKIVPVQFGASVAVDVYPNPSESGIFEVYLKQGNYQMVVVNSLGSTLKQHSFSSQTANNKFTVDLSTFPRGMYFLHVRTETKPYTIKLLHK